MAASDPLTPSRPSGRLRRFRRHPVIRLLKRLWFGLALAFLVWQAWSFQAHGVSESVLQSDHFVRVETNGERIAFLPATRRNVSGLLFYPGGLVEPAAYAPFARALAEHGHPAVILRLPLRTAMLPGQREDLFARTRGWLSAEPRTRWMLGGHSRGGALATQFAARHPDLLAGLVLIGTSHPRDEDLSTMALPVTKVYGTRDGLASEAEVERYRPLLPPTTHWVRMEGGNHAQFGYYGHQLMDDTATMSRADQQEQLLRAVLAALGRARPPAP